MAHDTGKWDLVNSHPNKDLLGDYYQGLKGLLLFFQHI